MTSGGAVSWTGWNSSELDNLHLNESSQQIIILFKYCNKNKVRNNQNSKDQTSFLIYIIQTCRKKKRINIFHGISKQRLTCFCTLNKRHKLLLEFYDHFNSLGPLKNLTRVSRGTLCTLCNFLIYFYARLTIDGDNETKNIVRICVKLNMKLF